jgi:dynein heavy chain, axonemal
VQPRTAAGEGQSREAKIEEIAQWVQARTPAPFDFEGVYRQYPTSYE